ncbi:MAG: hypothetical protein PUE01_11630 [Clostridiaceae bacterium]|nr:hypothetical protein [Clostridiaceae bacterium]
MRKLKRILYSISTCIIMVFCLVGVYGIITAPSEKDNTDQLKLEEELEANSKAIEEDSDDNLVKTEEDKESQKSSTITIIGDSVMLGAAPSVKEKIPGCIIDAKKSRQAKECVGILKQLDKENKLGDTVVIALGVNGPFDKEEGQKILDYLGKRRKVYWVTAYGRGVKWQNSVNSTIEELAQENNNLRVIDWNSVGDSHKSWFYSDGIHLNGEGQVGYADFIANQI